MALHNVHYIWNEPEIVRRFESAVSLHSHSDRSRESLESVPRYVKRSVFLRLAAARARAKYKQIVGRELDFAGAYFIPPLSASAAYFVEAGQIEALGVRPMVSITDHDTISAPKQLQVFLDPGRVPISMEWTVPFGPTHFHIGVHNLPPDSADDMVKKLREFQCSYCRATDSSCTGAHDSRCLADPRMWMERLSAIPDTLLVLNHPLWDTCGLGASAHLSLLSAFLTRHRACIHAFELNGLRSWVENARVLKLAEQWNVPLMSGGDRHGCEPNAVLNLTAQETFSGFAREVREERRSVIVFMRQYQPPLGYRKLRTAWDVLKTRGRIRWSDRICIPWIDGRVLPLSAAEWSGQNGQSRYPMNL